ncbi:MAG: radical SAM protein [bacterium]|nr:radical SAM protein [bacterium]
MKNLKVSKYLHLQQVDEDKYIGWNRYFPSIFVLNKGAMKLLDLIREGKTIGGNGNKNNEKVRGFIKGLKKNKFLYEGTTDSSLGEFREMVRQETDEMEQVSTEFYGTKRDYDHLRIVNDVCNLGCSYCMKDFLPKPAGARVSPEEKLRIIDSCVDRFMDRKIANGSKEAGIFFNGGEILVDWKIIKRVVARVTGKYPDINVKFGINTNLTRLTKEMAIFFDRYEFSVSVSIDGYKEAHDKTRVYHNGKGSFDHIMEKVKLYREHNKKDRLNKFQGTIDFEQCDDFQPEEVYKMTEYGFSGARLAPNLLHVSQEEARKRARLMGRFLELNGEHDFQVTESFFSKAKKKINSENYRFSSHCGGLSGKPKLGVSLNITSLSVSQLCSFIGKGEIPLEDLDYDIYHPKLGETTAKYLRERRETFEANCMECSLVGLCSGGCILAGIDKNNRLNKTACAYQDELWKIYLKKARHGRVL